jgi:hypothetical protein
MSLLELSAALKKKIFTDWLNLKDPKNVIVDSNIYVQLSRELNPTGVSNASLSFSVEDNQSPKLQKALDRAITKIPLVDIAKEIIDLRGSPNFVDILRAGLLKSLQSKPAVVKVDSPKVKIHNKPPSKQIRDAKGQFYSLALLQELINTNLPHVLSANMGPYFGKQRKILNFRTGRFSTSAVVERMSQSKEGMITAFYSYMKYPYATFSKGGAQYTPSRDPKLLIAKSIKEIAATKVALKMRAINI